MCHKVAARLRGCGEVVTFNLNICKAKLKAKLEHASVLYFQTQHQSYGSELLLEFYNVFLAVLNFVTLLVSQD